MTAEAKNCPMQARTLVLKNGVELPRIGLGTFRAQGADVKLAVSAAIAAGIRHIDTAQIYKNEEQIAEVLRELRVPRDSVFITSKISPYSQGSAKAAEAVQGILQRLDTSYVDLLLIHWPGASKTPVTSPANAQLRAETWHVLEQCLANGTASSIGVSNYEQHHLQSLLQHASVMPAVNQIEVHPMRPCTELRAQCAAAGVAVVAYASLGCGALLQERVVQDVAARVGKTPAQVLLRWGLQSGCAVIPKSTHPQFIQQYSDEQLLTWNLFSADMACLNGLENGHRFCWDASEVL